MSSPAVATAHKDAALAIRERRRSSWNSFRTTDREITTSLGISVAVHLALLLVIRRRDLYAPATTIGTFPSFRSSW